MDIKLKLAEEFNLRADYASNIVDLINEGNTIPFIARYRKEMHGGCDDELLRDFADRLTYLTNLETRKEEVKNSIEGQGKWTDELAIALANAATMTEVEDIYRPYKQKKKTRASVAIARGLQPLADIILAQEIQEGAMLAVCEPYVHIDEEDAEKSVPTAQDALQGALDIIAETISDDAELRKVLREYLVKEGMIASAFNPKMEDKEKLGVYEMYNEYSEKVATLPSHRILALNRGEKEECLKVDIVADEEGALAKIKAKYLKNSIFNEALIATIADSYERLIFPSIEREVRNDLTDNANEQAIKMFEVNLKPLLMQAPLKGKTIMGLDPGYRTGCKVAVIDQNGNHLDNTVIFVAATSDEKINQSKAKVISLILKHKVDVISIGNGTASKETEIFVADLIKESPRPIQYIVVNEAGASVYSASKQGSEEFPDFDVTVRSAISIARRLMDPLAELIKIDVKSIGVGQYQHDMPQKRLTEVLEGVVEGCVNSVGVDLNTASYSLLSYVSGLNLSIAKNIVEYRKETPFTSRDQLLKVKKLGPKAYEQCAGFLRIPNADNILDNTGVHPESYDAAKKLLDMFGYTDEDVKNNNITDLKNKVALKGNAVVASELGIGEMTLSDIIDDLIKPGRDIRDSLPAPVLRADLMDLNDLKEGMELTGTVRNVIDFGAFVDIGVHHDGLVHISEISDGYIKHPSDVLKVGQVVKVKVIGVDSVKQRISLSMKAVDGGIKVEKPARVERKDRPNGEKKPFNKNNNNNKNNGQRFDKRNDRKQKQEEDLQAKLLALQNKFKR
ncbi:MAG: RNA-binding transcriptional accessory protein [Clostridiales bacterium]|nr:RNA-binding transcriptional accessory protein [Clostridiales bacterium]